MGFEQPSPSGLQLAAQLSPLQESSFTPHRTQPKNNLRQLLGSTGDLANMIEKYISLCEGTYVPYRTICGKMLSAYILDTGIALQKCLLQVVRTAL